MSGVAASTASGGGGGVGGAKRDGLIHYDISLRSVYCDISLLTTSIINDMVSNDGGSIR